MREQSPAERRERLDQFLRMLHQVAGQFAWRLDRFNQIRGFAYKARIKCCPLTALAYGNNELVTEICDVHVVAEELGFDDIALQVVDAADYVNRANELRVRIMKAVGLRE